MNTQLSSFSYQLKELIIKAQSYATNRIFEEDEPQQQNNVFACYTFLIRTRTTTIERTNTLHHLYAPPPISRRSAGNHLYTLLENMAINTNIGEKKMW